MTTFSLSAMLHGHDTDDNVCTISYNNRYHEREGYAKHCSLDLVHAGAIYSRQVCMAEVVPQPSPREDLD